MRYKNNLKCNYYFKKVQKEEYQSYTLSLE